MIPASWEQRAKHLEFLQSAIARLSTNSFLVKGWTMTVTGAFLAVAAQFSTWSVAATALAVTVGFWCLDSYYLRQERLFRSLYEKAAVGDPAAVPLFTMDVDRYGGPVGNATVFLSRTLLLFYGIPVLIDVAGIAVLV
ncbi:hypothetical protein [Streptomyces sp. cg35]|uniref:hypothetical protein n=1 Tax=Streptomyces sp. cg35 TaxID=3421650 RepID=UPI003D16263B